MRIGSIVEVVGDFTRVSADWNFPYPKKGDVLTVSNIESHPNSDVRGKGIVLLFFEELPNLVGVCDTTFYGEANFKELMPPVDMKLVYELINNPPLLVINK